MQSSPDPGRAGRAQVLVGVSDAELAAQARAALERDGHDVTVSGAPEALLASFDPMRTALVLLAFDHMPADGFALCEALRSIAASRPVPILVAAPHVDERSVARAFAAGANDFVTRPVQWSLLRHRVRDLLRSSRMLIELRASRASLESAQRIARLGSWELDVDSRDMSWSPETFRTLGVPPGGVSTNLASFSQKMHPEDRPGVVRETLAAIREERSFDVSHRVVLPTGAVRHVQLRGERAEVLGHARLHGTIQDVTDQHQTQERIRYLAHYDSLTGLSNRRRFKDQLERAIERARNEGRLMALLYMDLDQFKRINDTLGHSAGDTLLQHVSKVLFDKVRTTDIIGRNVLESASGVEISRLGGDEFAVVLADISQPEDAGQVAERILSAVTTPIEFEEHQISTTASIGIAIYPGDGEDAETLVKHADTAMYKAKDRGRNLHEFFSRAMGAGTLRKLAIETHLRHALERGELRVVYQPRVALGDGRISGVEALLRWEHPELGAVLPKEFIPVAEETGLIVPIGEWVLETACAQAQRWRQAGLGDLRVSVNVSSRQFMHHDLRSTVLGALDASKLEPAQLELEITESVVLEDDENTGGALRVLKDMGVRIALDDFGTGYSSLSYLTRFPLDTLKLDRSLVRDLGGDPTARGVATAVITMAHAVHLAVTAEGVDAVEQAAFLRREGCDEMQGFLVAGPLEPEECAKMLASPGSALAPLAPALASEEAEDETAELPALKPRRARRGARR